MSRRQNTTFTTDEQQSAVTLVVRRRVGARSGLTAKSVLVSADLSAATGRAVGRVGRAQVTRFRAVATRLGGRYSGRSVFLLVLHPSVLEPDFHLFLGQPQTVGDLDAPQPRQVHVAGELAFQFQQLIAGERRPDPLRTPGVRVALAVIPQRVLRFGAFCKTTKT